MKKSAFIKAIKKAKEVYVWKDLTTDEGTQIKVVKESILEVLKCDRRWPKDDNYKYKVHDGCVFIS